MFPTKLSMGKLVAVISTPRMNRMMNHHDLSFYWFCARAPGFVFTRLCFARLVRRKPLQRRTFVLSCHRKLNLSEHHKSTWTLPSVNRKDFPYSVLLGYEILLKFFQTDKLYFGFVRGVGEYLNSLPSYSHVNINEAVQSRMCRNRISLFTSIRFQWP